MGDCPRCGWRSIVMSVSVCLSVCLSVRNSISETTHVTRPIFSKFLCTLPMAWSSSGGVAMLCTSGFMDDIKSHHICT